MYASEGRLVVIDRHHQVPLQATHVASVIVVLGDHDVGRVLQPPVPICDSFCKPILERAVVVLKAAGCVPFEGLQLLSVDKLKGLEVRNVVPSERDLLLEEASDLVTWVIQKEKLEVPLHSFHHPCFLY